MSLPAAEECQPTWAIVELMGHIKLAGRLTEEEKFGTKMGRLDIPTVKKCETCNGTGQNEFMGPPCNVCDGAKEETNFVTQFFGGGSVYRITIVTEEVARHIAKASSDIAPVRPWDLPRQLTGRTARDDEEFDDDQ